jgi:hypothetical protein
MKPIREWHNGTLTVDELFIGSVIFGGTGSGKTSGPAKWLSLGTMAHETKPGFLVCCVKKSEADMWQYWAHLARRSDDVVRFSIGSGHSFSFLEYEAKQEGGTTENIVELLMSLATFSAPPEGTGDGEAQFFETPRASVWRTP